VSHKHAPAAGISSLLLQGVLHAAVTDKFKRRVTWHRALPFDFAAAVDRNRLFLISGLFYSQQLAAASEVVEVIDYVRGQLWCPSSGACCVQQQGESCFMSALLLHAVCVAHPLFTFCGAVADAVQRLLGWMQRPILLTVDPSNPLQIVTIQPQSLDTWPSPAIPLEAHTLVTEQTQPPPQHAATVCTRVQLTRTPHRNECWRVSRCSASANRGLMC